MTSVAPGIVAVLGNVQNTIVLEQLFHSQFFFLLLIKGFLDGLWFAGWMLKLSQTMLVF